MINRTIQIADAIKSLLPNSEFYVIENQYSGLTWLSDDLEKPTQQEVETELARLQTEFDNKEYQRQRALEYPGLGDQLDMLWHAIDSGTLNKTSDFYTAIKAVKDAYPKSE